MLKHQLVINVEDSKGKSKGVVKGGRVNIRERILYFLFGKNHDFLVLVPSDTVESVAIKEVLAGE